MSLCRTSRTIDASTYIEGMLNQLNLSAEVFQTFVLKGQLRTPEAGGFFGLCKEEGWDFSDCWMMGQHEPCAAAVKALKSMGTPELSKAACDPNKNAMYKECLAAA
ncbi:unnamed protein product [Symbiodinium microadriaticum]|nr:unnamed protein product [Symbiodinium microadriaticum]